MHKTNLPHRRAGHGVPLVLVHVYLGGSAQWDAEIAHFSDRLDVIAPDLPGFGDAATEVGHSSIEGMADRIIELLDDLGIGDFILMGHSKGGMIAQEMAAKLAALDAMTDWDGRAALKSLTMPTLVVWGHDDRSYRWPQVETLWKTLPNATLSVIPGASHAAHLENRGSLLQFSMISCPNGPFSAVMCRADQSA